jgi:hypothetical protein
VATTDEKAYAAVEEALKQNPDATLDELWDKAKAASPAVGKIGRREFNARYPLQVKRRKQREAGGGGGAKKAGTPRKARGGAKASAAAKKAGGTKRRGRPAASGAADGTAGAKATRSGAPARKRPGRPKGSGRKTAAPAATAPSAGSGSGADREAIRREFLNFATELVNAGDQPKNLVKVLAGVDRYVDRVAKSAS